MPVESTGAFVPVWVALITALGGVLAVAVPAYYTFRNGSSRGQRRGLNAPPEITEPSNATGLARLDIDRLMSTVIEVSKRQANTEEALAEAQREIIDLKQKFAYKQFALRQAINWGINVAGEPPRPVPDWLQAFIQDGGITG